MTKLRNSISVLALALLAAALVAGCGDSDDGDSPAVTTAAISDAWARTTAPKATMGAAYMNITSQQADRLTGVEVSSDVAESAEIHETVMKDSMDGKAMAPVAGQSHDAAKQKNKMTMREVKSIELPAGETVKLKPGGYHVMLLDLIKPIEAGQQVTLTLVFEKAGRQEVAAVAKD